MVAGLVRSTPIAKRIMTSLASAQCASCAELGKVTHVADFARRQEVINRAIARMVRQRETSAGVERLALANGLSALEERLRRLIAEFVNAQ